MLLKSLYWKDRHKGKWRREGGANHCLLKKEIKIMYAVVE